MAGAVGFEPTIPCTKSRCLTTWPRPYKVQPNYLAVTDLKTLPHDILFTQGHVGALRE